MDAGEGFIIALSPWASLGSHTWFQGCLQPAVIMLDMAAYLCALKGKIGAQLNPVTNKKLLNASKLIRLPDWINEYCFFYAVHFIRTDAQHMSWCLLAHGYHDKAIVHMADGTGTKSDDGRYQRCDSLLRTKLQLLHLLAILIAFGALFRGLHILAYWHHNAEKVKTISIHYHPDVTDTVSGMICP